MGTVLIFILAITVSSLIAYAVGKQGRTSELVELEFQLDKTREHLASKNDKINYLHAEIDHWQRRVRRLEDQLIAGAHLNAIPPRVMRATDIGVQVGKLDPLPEITAEAEAFGISTIRTQEVIKSLGPKEPPTPSNHKEVG